MDNPLMHYILLDEQIQFDGTIAKLAQKIAAVVGDTADKAIVEAIIAAARAEEVTDLYMIDKKFILDAIREKQELENQKPLTNGDRIRAMSDEELTDLLWDAYNAGSDDAEAWHFGYGHRYSFEWDLEWLQKPAKEET